MLPSVDPSRCCELLDVSVVRFNRLSSTPSTDLRAWRPSTCIRCTQPSSSTSCCRQRPCSSTSTRPTCRVWPPYSRSGRVSNYFNQGGHIFSCVRILLVVWFVGRIKKLRNLFPQNLTGGWILAQNRPHLILGG